jgi:chromosome partitioning protein
MITVIGNLKGGSGKSTVTFNIGVWLATAGVPVAMFDLDPQRTLSDVVEVREEEQIQPALSVHHVADGAVAKAVSARRETEVLVDVGSLDFEAMKQALGVAQRIVVPVGPSQADIWSTQRFLRIIEDAVTASGRVTGPDVLGFVNRADTHHMVRETDEAEAALAQMSGIQWIRHRLAQRTAFRRSFSEGLAVFELVAWSKAAEEFDTLASGLYPGVAAARR